MHPLLFFRTSEASAAFEDYNINYFLKKFEAIYNNFSINEKIKLRRILKYYKNNIIKKIKNFAK